MATQEELTNAAGAVLGATEGPLADGGTVGTGAAGQIPPRRGPGRPSNASRGKPTVLRGPGGKFSGSLPAGKAPAAERIEWAAGAPYLANLAGPLYDGLGVARPPLDQWAAFCAAWGAVADKYLPTLGGYKEETAALFCTIAVGGPLFLAWNEKRSKHGKGATSQTGDRASAPGPPTNGAGMGGDTPGVG